MELKKMKQKILLIAALFFGILTFMLAYYQIKYEKEQIRGTAKIVYLVKMKRDMTADEKIGTNDIESIKQMRAVSQKTREIEWNNKDNIIGRRLNSFVKKGDILTWYDMRDEETTGREGLAAIIPEGNGMEGMRAISISVDATSSVTGLVRPNHHVDIIGTFKFPEMKGDMSLDTLTLTILQNVTILATGSQMANTRSASTDTQKKSYSTVTLALTPKEVEMIVFASQKGHLTLSLRSYENAMITHKLQSINFKYLEEHLEDYNIEREKLMKEGKMSTKSSGGR